MKPKNATRAITLHIGTTAMCLLLASCTTVIKADKREAHYTTDKKIPLSIALNLTDELRNSKWEQKALTGGGTQMAVGPALAEDAPEFARSTFTDVVEINNGSPPPKPVAAILTPKMAYVGMTYGQTMFSQDTITLKLEWTLADSAGNVLWADTVTGLGRSRGGFSKDLKLALEDVFAKSQQTMLAAQAIQQFAEKNRAEARK